MKSCTQNMLVGYKKNYNIAGMYYDRSVSSSKASMAAAGISLCGWVIPVPAGITKRTGLAGNGFILISVLVSFQAHNGGFSFVFPELVVVGALNRSSDGLKKCVTRKKLHKPITAPQITNEISPDFQFQSLVLGNKLPFFIRTLTIWGPARQENLAGLTKQS